jgi:hypothetical protein
MSRTPHETIEYTPLTLLVSTAAALSRRRYGRFTEALRRRYGGGTEAVRGRYGGFTEAVRRLYGSGVEACSDSSHPAEKRKM